MWKYLKDLDIFFKHYITLHNYMTNIAEGLNDKAESAPKMDVVIESHKHYSATFIKILDYFQGNVDYIRLMHEDKHLFEDMILCVPQHFRGGSKLEYLLSGHNLLTACFCQMTVDSDLKDFDKIEMLENIRKISNAFTVVIANLWKKQEDSSCSNIVKAKENSLKLEKERFKRYIDSRGSLIFFINNDGIVLRANKAAEDHFSADFSSYKFNIIDVLDYHFLSFPSFLNKFNSNELQQLRLMNGEKFLIDITSLLEESGSPVEYVLTMKFVERANNLGGGMTHLPLELKSVEEVLTQTESHISEMIEQGLSSKEIADSLNISIETVKTHRRNIRKKFKLGKTGENLFIYLKKKGKL